MNSDLMSLSKIFTENIFRIPDYQRGYSWTARQLKDFWSDLMLLDNGKDHYTGVLTLEIASDAQVEKWTDDLWIIKSKRFQPYYVVDGQQRLTTSLILIQALVERLKKKDQLNYASADDIRRKFLFESKDGGVSRSYIFGYEKDNPSYEFLKTNIFKEKSENHSSEEDTIYTQNLAAAKAFFIEQMQDFDLERLEVLFTKLTQHFLFNIYTITGDIDVFVAFETMNNRGKALSNLELLKNRLIFLSTRIEADSDERQKLRLVVNEAWKSVYHYLGRNHKRPLDDDDFLSLHFTLYYGADLRSAEVPLSRVWNSRHEEFYKEYLLNSIFTTRRCKAEPEISDKIPPLTLNSIFDYAQDIKQTVQVYYQLFNPDARKFTSDQVLNLIRLDRLGWSAPQPLIIAAIAKNPLATDLSKLLKALERVTFFSTLISGPRKTFDMLEFALGLRNGNETVNSIAMKIDSAMSQQNLADALIFGGMKEGGPSYYGWRGIRYFLFEYEQSLKTKAKASRDKLEWNTFMSENFEGDFITVEHIFPQKAKGEYWEKNFKGLNNHQRRALRDSLGNLLALSQPKNSSLGNRSFHEKRDGFGETAGYRTGSYSEIEVAHLADWTPKEILTRGFKMLEFFERRWNVSLGDPAVKAKMLGLEFLSPKSQDNSK